MWIFPESLILLKTTPHISLHTKLSKYLQVVLLHHEIPVKVKITFRWEATNSCYCLYKPKHPHIPRNIKATCNTYYHTQIQYCHYSYLTHSQLVSRSRRNIIRPFWYTVPGATEWVQHRYRSRMQHWIPKYNVKLSYTQPNVPATQHTHSESFVKYSSQAMTFFKY